VTARKCLVCPTTFELGNYGGRKKIFCSTECRSKYYGDRRPSRAGVPYDRNAYLYSTYGITEQEYDRLLAEQGGTCAVCHGPQIERNGSVYFHVDHNHTTGAVRGLVCILCNRQLSWLETHWVDIMRHLSKG
jgi:hypothetical protein